jgi:hypothetical protein
MTGMIMDHATERSHMIRGAILNEQVPSAVTFV